MSPTRSLRILALLLLMFVVFGSAACGKYGAPQRLGTVNTNPSVEETCEDEEEKP